MNPRPEPSLSASSLHAHALPERRRRAPLRVALDRIGKLLVLAWIVVASVVLLVRHVALPAVAEFRTEIAAAAGQALGLPVTLGAIQGDWAGWRPRLILQQVTVADGEGSPALHLPRVDATLAWSSLLRLQAHFHRLEISAPELALRREADGRLFVAGLQVGADAGAEGGALAWLLEQRQIVIHDARLRWDDRLRGAPELALEKLEFRLDQRFGSRRFALRAQPPQALASTLDVRGELRRLDLATPLASVGRLYIALERADLGGWRPWVDYPRPVQGVGGVRAWLESHAGSGVGSGSGSGPGLGAGFELARALKFGRAAAPAWAVTADLALAQVRTQLDADLPELVLDRLDGRLGVERDDEGYRLHTRGLTLRAADGLALLPTDLELQLGAAARAQSGDEEGGAMGLEGEGGMPGRSGRLVANRLDFDALARLAAFLPLDAALRVQLATLAPSGRLDALRLRWEGALAAPTAWEVSARFADLGFAADAGLPGLGGLSGTLEGDQGGGRYRLDSRGAHVDMPEIFDSTRLQFDQLRADGGWQRRAGQLEITLDSAQFENPDAAGQASGVYRPQTGSAGEIDLQAKLTRAEGTAVWRYLPRVVGSHTQDWVRTSIRQAEVPEASLRLRGALNAFPFRDGEGEFRVVIRVANAILDYATGWPVIEGIFGEVRFEGPGMRIEAARARIFGAALTDVVADVPDLDVQPSEVMTITGKAAGPSAEFLRFVSASPVSARIGGFTDAMRAQGRGRLDLRLVMPLRQLEDSTVEGEYRFAANRLWLVEGLPVLEDAGGRLRFSADTLSLPEARAQFLGAPARVSAQTLDDGTVRFEASGAASVSALSAAWDSPLLDHVSGSAEWKARIDIARGATRLKLESDLLGLTSSLPAPLNKSAAQAWPLRVDLDGPTGQSSVQLKLELAQWLRAELEWPGEGAPLRGGLALNARAEEVLPRAEEGVLVTARFDAFDADAWRRVLDRAVPAAVADEPAADGSGLEATRSSGAALPALAGVSLEVKKLQVFGQLVNDFALRSVADQGGWRAQVASDRVLGELDWRDAGAGALRARLERLSLGGGEEGGGEDGNEPVSKSASAHERDETPPRQLPALDVVAERFLLRGKELGRLELFARNRAGVWQLERFGLSSADGQLKGSGEWRTRGQQSTRLDFSLQVADIGRFSRRLGYDDVVRGGKATLGGQVRWQGAPTRIDYPSLAGRMDLAAEAGQFNKLEPGVGRLLGILSLQSLPRRITLDFRDVFSEGFAFDGISGSIDVADGVMHTEDLSIRGPAARVRMRGTADVEAETQDLRVAVQPTLSESVAIGAAASLLNPVAGVLTYLAQKALSDPIEKLFAYEYEIRGTWDDPEVRRPGAGKSAPVP